MFFWVNIVCFYVSVLLMKLAKQPLPVPFYGWRWHSNSEHYKYWAIFRFPSLLHWVSTSVLKTSPYVYPLRKKSVIILLTPFWFIFWLCSNWHHSLIFSHLGKCSVKLEISSRQNKVAGMKSVKRSCASSGLELKLDELRKELSSVHGGIFPHSVLSTQQINMISAQKPNSMELVRFVNITLPFNIFLAILHQRVKLVGACSWYGCLWNKTYNIYV